MRHSGYRAWIVVPNPWCTHPRSEGSIVKNAKFTARQIVAVLQLARCHQDIRVICRRFHISRATYYRWCARYAGLSVEELTRLRQLDAENQRLQQRLRRMRSDCRMLRLLLKHTGASSD
ncbi:helix-turn-helix domain-containing protein [Burkholderia stagnalis]